MRIVTTNLLNRFWKNGIIPIKNALEGKLDRSKAVNNMTTTEPGYYMDARQGPVIMEEFNKINGNLLGLTTFSGANVIPSAYIDSNVFKVTKVGKICILNGYALFNANVGNSEEIFRVPDQYKPIGGYQFMLTKYDNANVIQFCTIGADGIVKTWTNNAKLDAKIWFLMSPVVYICK